ncbi:sensor histidine kinase [Algicola sagamiensis]|uniref:sensor histidine kinase n=1 Tax=Algicola sagamiensis TaxID=163869 RepID=UPI0003A867AE|nr:HAMP domain-containing sensor histidine kinase [Algicola sagamiensis]
MINFPAVLASSIHDMKNSLFMLIQSVDNLSQMLEEKDSVQGQELAKLHYEASRLNSNLLQLLGLYRADIDQLPFTIEEHFLDDLIEESVFKNQLYIEHHNIHVNFDIDPDISWYFDYDLVSHLINDAVINALRYCKDKIQISCHIFENELHISVEDDGRGYPEDMMASYEKPMETLDFSTGRTGLGIFFARLIAESHENHEHRGKIVLSNNSDLGGGVFTVVLP